MNQNPQTALLTGEPQMINTMGVDMPNLRTEWKASANYVEQYTRDFPQLQQIVDAVPLNAADDVPYVADTTLPGLVRSIARNAAQQMPTYSVIVNGSKVSKNALIASSLLKKYAFNEDTFGKGLLSTVQIGIETALTQGYAPFMVTTEEMFGDFGTRLKMLHWSDTSPEPGIQDHNETGYDYVIAHVMPSRLKRILKRALRDPENTTWNANAIKKVLETDPKPTSYYLHQDSVDQNAAGESAGASYTLISRYETGEEPTIVTFCPEIDDEPLRVFSSNSKWGYPRVMYLVIDPAGLTPFGKSRVRLASPNQNLLNIYYGNIASLLILNSKPPLFRRGTFMGPTQLKTGAVWSTNDPQGEARLMNLDNGSLQTFQVIQQALSGQIRNIMGDPRPTPTSGNDGYSKVGPGVRMQQQDIDASTNQVVKIVENFIRQYGLVALDTLLSEQEGEEDIIVDDDTKNALNRIEPGMVGDDNKVHMNWGIFYDEIEEMSVEVSVSIGKDELEEKKRADLQDAMVVLGQNAGEIPGAAEKASAISDQLIDDLNPEMPRLPQANPKDLPQQQIPDEVANPGMPVPSPSPTPQQ